MPHFLITYDLRKQREYSKLIKQLRDWNAISPLESVWFATLKGPASTIRDILKSLTDSDDGILLVELKVGADWATYNVNEKAGDWLKTNVSA